MAPATAARKTKPAKPRNTPAAATTPSPDVNITFHMLSNRTKAAGVPVLEATRIVPWQLVRPSPENPRQDFNADFMAELAESIKAHGQQAPITVRSVVPGKDTAIYEIIDGETRWRACQAHGIPTVVIQPIECTPAEAAVLRLLAARQRRDLNAIEEARGLRTLLETHQLSQRDLSAQIGISQGQISNRLRLLNLPERWQQAVISGEISATHARELAAWADVPEVVDQLTRDTAKIKPEQLRERFSEYLADAIDDHSLALDHYCCHYGLAKVNVFPKPLPAELRTELRVRERTDPYTHKTYEVATAASVWKPMLAAAEKMSREKYEKSLEKGTKNSANSKEPKAQEQKTPEQLKQLKEQQERAKAKRLWRYHVTWLQQRVIQAIAECAQTQLLEIVCNLAVTYEGDRYRRGCYEERTGGSRAGHRTEDYLGKLLAGSKDAIAPIRELAAVWLAGSIEGYHPQTPPESIVAVGKYLGLTWDQWQPDEDYLQLFNKDELLDLARQWKLVVPKQHCGATWPEKRGPLITAMLIAGTKAKIAAPAAVVKAKAVSLV